MKLNELEKILISSGYILARTNKHRIWTKTGNLPVSVPNHRFVNKMVAKKILKEIKYVEA